MNTSSSLRQIRGAKRQREEDDTNPERTNVRRDEAEHRCKPVLKCVTVITGEALIYRNKLLHMVREMCAW